MGNQIRKGPVEFRQAEETVCHGSFNSLAKFGFRKKLQQLAKHAAKLIHWWPSFKFDRPNQLPQLKEALFFKKLTWTRVIPYQRSIEILQ
jgi:hypothetical protein